MPESSVCIRPLDAGGEIRFSGVTQLKLGFSAKVTTGGESAGTEAVNSAVNQPDKLTLSVVESEVGHPEGWCRRMVETLESLKRRRQAVSVETPLHIFPGMLLSDLTVVRDDRTGDGLTATLVFTEIPAASSGASSGDTSGGRASGGSSGYSYGGMSVGAGRSLTVIAVPDFDPDALPTAETLRQYIRLHGSGGGGA